MIKIQIDLAEVSAAELAVFIEVPGIKEAFGALSTRARELNVALTITNLEDSVASQMSDIIAKLPRRPIHPPPYVHNAPLLALSDTSPGPGIAVLTADRGRLEIRTMDVPGPYDVTGVAYHLTTTWNFHDPLVDALRTLIERPSDEAVICQARGVLDVLAQAEDSAPTQDAMAHLNKA